MYLNARLGPTAASFFGLLCCKLTVYELKKQAKCSDLTHALLRALLLRYVSCYFQASVPLSKTRAICSKAIYHAPSWLSAFGTPGPPLRGRGQIGPFGAIGGSFPHRGFSLSPYQEWLTVADSSMDK
jgi:hypothetical protein